MDRRNDTDAELAASEAMQVAAAEIDTIGDFVCLTESLWVHPGAVLGGRVVKAPSPEKSSVAVGPKFTGSIVQLLMMEAGWITVALGTQDECNMILRQFLLTIYNNTG